ncbi:MAG TPA: DUF4038 domain-containing protein [Candidatus Latescibacteria bacterium]|nr:DUF4038 domain-containing protein [Candidatus Latescibacterota bacterium]HOF61973.1 DUF4038 domain-containing protein [Candidatus Latescibacterota bacterium]HOS65164.1 DUF4038 domain-containing protein [Candidatus Latescibacterota bacterium]HPK74260.1 DUF4038 domain-containing protein [Candidatus Latescibacterota bacterium]
MELHARTNCIVEIPFRSAAVYRNPYADVTLDVAFSNSRGAKIIVPAFWAGGATWKVRFSAPSPGTWKFQSICDNRSDIGLHGRTGAISVQRYKGSNPVLKHGRVRVSPNGRYLEHQDGTPFFWLGDTWWMGLCARVDWPQGFKELTADRVAKGFSVVQIIAGPYPDMDAFDPRSRNEAGFAFEKGFTSVNPSYYDHSDLKIGHLVESGLVPCIVGMWGYYLPEIGVEQIKRFWRYLIARYGAYPVVWCAAGEGTMPWYLSKTPREDARKQKSGWTDVCRYIRSTDGFGNVLTIHPTRYGHEQVEDRAVLDLNMLQTGHSGYESVGPTIESVRTAYALDPPMPVLDSEVNYEGILGKSWQDVQRLCFWHSILNGACGHTYGANGIWQCSTKAEPYGASPHGRSWGNTPWQEAMKLPGSTQLGLARKFLLRIDWHQMEPHPEWTQDGASAAGIPKRLRVIYSPMVWDPPVIKELEPDVKYHARFFDPVTGAEYPVGPVDPAPDRTWTPPVFPEMHDWVIVLKAVTG